jgi:hypothetical protein
MPNLKIPSPATAMSFLALVISLGGAGVAATGGNFILGRSSSATSPSVLIGSVATNTLELRNLSAATGATALRLNTAANRAPMRVNSSVRVANLNADYLDGLTANALGRVAYKEQISTAWTEDGRTTLQTVTLDAPQDGFVTLSGGAIAAYNNGCAYCAVHTRFRIDAATDTSTAGMVINQDGIEQYAPLSHTVTVPVTSGTHTYQLIGSWLDINATNVDPDTWYDATLSAQFIPFNGAGTTTPPLAAKTIKRKPVRSLRAQAHRRG